jgi:hypothetical protein
MIIGKDVSIPEEKQQMHRERWEYLCELDPYLKQGPVGLTDQDLDEMLNLMLQNSLN